MIPLLCRVRLGLRVFPNRRHPELVTSLIVSPSLWGLDTLSFLLRRQTPKGLKGVSNVSTSTCRVVQSWAKLLYPSQERRLLVGQGVNGNVTGWYVWDVNGSLTGRYFLGVNGSVTGLYV